MEGAAGCLDLRFNHNGKMAAVTVILAIAHINDVAVELCSLLVHLCISAVFIWTIFCILYALCLRGHYLSFSCTFYILLLNIVTLLYRN